MTMVPPSQPPQLHSTRVPTSKRSVVVATSASLMYMMLRRECSAALREQCTWAEQMSAWAV